MKKIDTSSSEEEKVSSPQRDRFLQQHFVDPIIAKRPQQEVKEEEKKEVDPVPSRYGFPQELV